MQPVPAISADDVNRVILREFGRDSLNGILSLLEEYGTEPWHREVHRVRMAILKLSDRKVSRLRQFLETAKQDYRDVLAYAEYPGYFTSSVDMQEDSRELEQRKQKIIAADWQQYSDWIKGS